MSVISQSKSTKIALCGAAAAFLSVSALGVALARDDERGRGPRGGAEMLRALDGDGDGRLTREEFEEGRAARFSDADADGSGDLSADELAMEMERRRQEARAARHARMFERLDEDEDGAVSQAELDAMADRMFSAMDRDEDGVIDLDRMRGDGWRGRGRHDGRGHHDGWGRHDRDDDGRGRRGEGYMDDDASE